MRTIRYTVDVDVTEEAELPDPVEVVRYIGNHIDVIDRLVDDVRVGEGQIIEWRKWR